uniref:Uncharacterized protein n=1 Tax=Quercus lobata TaxID=97700 RepID=A0A7N2LGT9_QUELO
MVPTSTTADSLPNDTSEELFFFFLRNQKGWLTCDITADHTPQIHRLYINYPSKPETGRGDPVSSVYCATKFYEKGVRFEETKEGRFDEIKFKKWELLGKCQCLISWLLIFLPCLKCIPCLEPMRSLLYLPSFVADNRTEELFRNIMALEQCHYPLEACLCNYMVLLDHLINTSEDVELLVDKGIIVNGQGSYQEVANMVNRIALEIVEENSYYGDVAKKLKNHYKNGCNRNIGYVKSTYFSNLCNCCWSYNLGIQSLGFC